MEEYTRKYLEYYKFTDFSFVTCEVCKKQATEIHHVHGRRGKLLNDISNLVALCRECHSNQKIINALRVGKRLGYFNFNK